MELFSFDRRLIWMSFHLNALIERFQFLEIEYLDETQIRKASLSIKVFTAGVSIDC